MLLTLGEAAMWRGEVGCEDEVDGSESLDFYSSQMNIKLVCVLVCTARCAGPTVSSWEWMREKQHQGRSTEIGKLHVNVTADEMKTKSLKRCGRWRF